MGLFNGGFEVLNGKAEELIGCGGGNRNGTMREPLDGLTDTLSLGANIPDPVTAVVVEGGT